MIPENYEDLFSPEGDINIRNLAKLITTIENNPSLAEYRLSKIYRENKYCKIIGITGPPGAGKSSLTDGIISKFRAEGKKVAVIAVDPSSPFTGGAILGDRIRMSTHSTDPNVFIRSMGSRGSLGGLAPASVHILNLLKSVGFDVVIIETVGVGQSEVDVMSVADTVLLVLVPGLGDDIQALKAGIMEIADIFVINKSDKDGKEKLIAEINMILHLNMHRMDWVPPIVETVATEMKGLDELKNKIEERHVFVESNFDKIRKEKLTAQFLHIIQEKVGTRIMSLLKEHNIIENWSSEILSGKKNPYQAITELDEKLSIIWDK